MAPKIGKYEVIGQIGRGGMGTIYRARDPILQRAVALKVISNLEVTPELRRRFFREAQACARITHPNIVIVHDMGEDDGRLFIVMELLEGEELRRVIARQAQLSLKDKLDIVRQLCDGLHFAHQKGVVHRDIKPANVIVLRTGQVKILDFGIAQIAGAATQRDRTRTGMFMGTLRYMAPEQVRGQADRRSDIFSVAAVSYELLSGRAPFAGDDPLQILEQLRTATPPRLTELDPSLPSALADVIERALQKEPGDRFADLEQMGRRLELVQRELAEGAADARVGDARPLARPSSLLGPPAPVAATTPPATTPPALAPPATVHDLDGSARVRRPPDDHAARETDSEPVGRVPRIAIATGAALAAIVAVALYLWLPAAPRGARVEAPAAPASKTGAAETAAKAEVAPRAETPAKAEVATEAKEKPRATDRTASVVKPSASTPSPSANVNPSASLKPERTSPRPGERDRAQSAGVAPSGPREEAEQARVRMTAARQAAERVAAGFYARQRFASAQSKERDGVAALGKSDYAAAVGLFAAAQSEYQAAMAEAPREEEKAQQLAQLRAGLDQAHAAAAARRQQALSVQADQLARDLFDQAQARQVEGDGLASRKDLAGAARAYQEAADRYGEAATRARAARPAR
jgi:Protein kinase domain